MPCGQTRASSKCNAQCDHEERQGDCGSIGPDAGCLAGAGASFLALFLELLTNALAAQVREVVNEQPALEVVELVLYTHRQHVLEVALKNLPAAILGTHAHPSRALHFVKDVGDRQAAFLGAAQALAAQNFRIDEHQRLIAFCRDVGDNDALVCIHLGCRKPDSGGRVHGVEQIIDQSCSSAPNTLTGSALVRSRGSGYSRMVRRAMMLDSQCSCI